MALQGPAPYGPPYYPFPYPPPPRKQQNPAAVIVLVVVVVFLIVSALGAILYVMVAGLIRVPNPPPMVMLGRAEMNRGNATLQVTSSARLDPSSPGLILQSNCSDGPPRTSSPGTRIRASPWSHTDTTRSRGCSAQQLQGARGSANRRRPPRPRR